MIQFRIEWGIFFGCCCCCRMEPVNTEQLGREIRRGLGERLQFPRAIKYFKNGHVI